MGRASHPTARCCRGPPCTGSSASHWADMPGYGDCRTAEIDASPQECFDALSDFERLPEWQGAVRDVRVLERDDAGRGSIVAYEIDAGLKTVRYRLRQIYQEPHRLAGEYLGG